MCNLKNIRNSIVNMPIDKVFTLQDLPCGDLSANTVVQMLNRMAKAGKIVKLGKGKFYKPRQTAFGALKPTIEQVSREFLIKDGRVVGYLTGYSAFTEMGLSTQISSEIQIGLNQDKRAVKRGDYTISFVLQKNPITRKNIPLLRILDALRFIRQVPASTPNEVCEILISTIRNLSAEDQRLLVKYALNYTPYVRALCGAILEYIGCDEALYAPLKQSLNAATTYQLPITVLPTTANWNIYEPTRK